MALSERYVALRFQTGVDTETDEKTVAPGQPTELENASFTKRVTVIKRPGTERLLRTRIGSAYSAISGAIGMASRDDDRDIVVLATTDEILSYDETAASWVKGGDWVHVRQGLKDLPRRSTAIWDPTTASTGSVRIVAWESLQGGIFAQLFNENGKSYGQEFRVSDVLGRCARAVTVGQQFHVYFVSGTTPNSLYVGVINPANPSSTAVSLTQLHSSLWSGGPYYDVAPIGTSANSALLAVSQSGSIYAAIIRPNGGIGTTSTTPAYPNPISGTRGTEIAPSVAVSDDGSTAVIAYRMHGPATSGTLAWVLNVNSLSTYASSSAYESYLVDSDVAVQGISEVNHLAAGFVSASLGTDRQFYVVSEVQATNANKYLRRSQCLVSNLTASLSGNLIRHTLLASTMFNMNDRPYVWGMHSTNLQSTDFLIRADDGLVVARSRHGLARSDVSGVMGNVDVHGTTAYRAATQRDQLPVPNSPLGSSSFSDRHIVLMSTEYAPAHSWKPVDVDGVLHMPGGWPGIYDGVQVVEHGFALDTEDATAAPGSGSNGDTNSDPWAIASGTLNGTGSFIWAAVPEWFDANGNRYLGGFSDYIAATLSGSERALHSQNQATLTIRTIAHTMKDGVRAPNLRFAVYRSGPNGTTLQRVGTVTNSTGSDTVTFLDTTSEVNRAAGELIYAADGGGPEDQNAMLPACSTYAMTGDRLYAAGLEDDPYGIRASKLRLGGAVNFTDEGELSVDAVGGPITALAPIDENLIVFKRSRAYRAPADGPSNASVDATPWPLVGLITSDVGVPEYGTIVEAAGSEVQGLVFWSDGRGARLLDRGLSCIDIGGPVRGYDDLTVVGGLAPSSHEEIRLYTSEGTTLVLNTHFNQWSTFTPQPAVAAANWDRRPTFVDSDGFVWAEDTGSYLDDGQSYPMSITLGWLPLQGSLQGLSRVRQLLVLGDYYTPHTLRVEAAYDYRDSWRTVRNIDVTASLGIVTYGGGTSGSVGSTGYGTGSYGGSDPVYQFRLDLPVQRMESLRLRISDQDATGRSFDLTELKLRIATESERARLQTRKIR